LASGNWPGDLQLWDVITGLPLAELQQHPAHVHSVAFSPDGRTLATGNADDTILLWSVTTRKELATLRGHRHVR
jgi:WD40 repeat protein